MKERKKKRQIVSCRAQSVSPRLNINPDDPQRRQKDYLNLAMIFRTSLDSVKDNYDTLVQQCREASII